MRRRLVDEPIDSIGTISYDDHGNSTAIFGETHGYDAANRHLTTVKGATTVAYTRDALDRIVERKVNGTVAARYSSSAGGDTPDLTLDGANNVIEQTLVLPGGAMYTNRPGAGGTWTEVDPVGDCTSTTTGRMVDIAVPASTAHDLFEGLDTVCRVNRPHTGDLDMTVHFTSDPRDQWYSYIVQGILVTTTSPGDFGRFDLVGGDLGSGSGVNAFVAASTDGQLDGNDIQANSKIIDWWDAASEWWIHLTRVGDLWTFSVSQDGTNYTTYASFTWAVTVDTIGLSAGNAGDNPAFAMQAEDPFAGQGTATQVWSYPNTHGDYVATTDGTGAKQGTTATFDPYGNLTSGAVPDNSAGSMDYGWLGQHQRPLEQQAGLEPMIEMGARQYSSRLGRFIEQDPIEGGSANDYDYVHGDPINKNDLTGMCWGCAGMEALILWLQSDGVRQDVGPVNPRSWGYIKKVSSSWYAAYHNRYGSPTPGAPAPPPTPVSPAVIGPRISDEVDIPGMVEFVRKVGPVTVACAAGVPPGGFYGGAAGAMFGPEGIPIGAAGGSVIGCAASGAAKIWGPENYKVFQ